MSDLLRRLEHLRADAAASAAGAVAVPAPRLCAQIADVLAALQIAIGTDDLESLHAPARSLLRGRAPLHAPPTKREFLQGVMDQAMALPDIKPGPNENAYFVVTRSLVRRAHAMLDEIYERGAGFGLVPTVERDKARAKLEGCIFSRRMKTHDAASIPARRVLYDALAAAGVPHAEDQLRRVKKKSRGRVVTRR